jgi:RNA polymerase sigma-70 factor (ECF subfamily)
MPQDVSPLPGDITQSVILVQRAQGGDERALNRLCERYYERVRRIVRLRLGRQLRSLVDSGDILQETFAQAVQAIESFEMRDEASLIHWLSRLAERQIIAAAAHHTAVKRDRAREVPLSRRQESTDGLFEISLPIDTTVPSERLSKAEQVEIVEECIRELSEEHRELVILRNYAGASWETVAAQTQRPSGDAARMMHARALIELGKLVRRRGLG